MKSKKGNYRNAKLLFLKDLNKLDLNITKKGYLMGKLSKEVNEKENTSAYYIAMRKALANHNFNNFIKENI